MKWSQTVSRIWWFGFIIWHWAWKAKTPIAFLWSSNLYTLNRILANLPCYRSMWHECLHFPARLTGICKNIIQWWTLMSRRTKARVIASVPESDEERKIYTNSQSALLFMKFTAPLGSQQKCCIANSCGELDRQRSVLRGDSKNDCSSQMTTSPIVM